MGRYKVVTYPWNLGMFSMQDPNTPYVKDEFDSLQQAHGSFNTAVSGNYTAVIWDSSDKKPVQAYHSSVDGGLGSHIVAGLAAAGVAGASIAGGIITFGAAGSAASTVYGTVKSQCGDGHALTKAFGFCVEKRL